MSATAKSIHDRRWWTLLVLCVTLLVISLDNTILNVALPTLERDLDATSEPAPVDRRRLHARVRRPAAHRRAASATASAASARSRVGLVPSSGASARVGASPTSPTMLIATRALMGIGGAFIMPATLSILTNVFPARGAGRRRSASGPASPASASRIGPVDRRLAARALLVGLGVPRQRPDRHRRARWPGDCSCRTSKDPEQPRLDPLGAVLSIVGLGVARLRPSSRRPNAAGLTAADPRRLRRVGRGARRPSSSGSCALDHPMLDVRVLPQPALHRRERRDHAGVLRAVRLDLPPDPVPAVRARLLAARGRRADAAVRRSR